jgi:hypothetical protein
MTERKPRSTKWQGRRGWCAWLATLAVAGWIPMARADEKAACSQAYVAAQSRRSEHRLLAARDELRVCARQECSLLMKGEMLKDCTDWLAQVEASIPSVVLSAKDSSGSDMTNVAVAIDKTVVVATLDGRSVDVDPGSHVFTFEAPGRDKVTLTALVLEGAKNQQIRAVFGPAAGEVVPLSAQSSGAREGGSSPPPPSEGAIPSSAGGEPRNSRVMALAPTHPNKALLVGGVVSLSVGYVAALVGGTVALASQSSSNGGCFGSVGFVLIPLAGPLLTWATYPGHQIVSYSSGSSGAQAIQVSDCNGGRSALVDAVVADEVLQLGGAALIVAGLLLRSPSEPREARRIARVQVWPGLPETPLGATLRVVGFE